MATASADSPKPTESEPTENDGPPVLAPRCVAGDHRPPKNSYSSDDDDFTDGAAAANVELLTITDWITGGAATGEIEVGCDEDWFAISPDNYHSHLLVRIEGTGESPLTQPRIWGTYRAGADGSFMPSFADLSAEANVYVHVLATHTGWRPFYIGINSESREATGSYRITVRKITQSDGIDSPGDVDTEALITAHGVDDISYRERGAIGGISDQDDRDWYRVHLEEGNVYGFTVTASAGYPRTFSYSGTLRRQIGGIYDPDGNLAKTEYDSRIYHQACETGFHFVEIRKGTTRTASSNIGTYSLWSQREPSMSIIDQVTGQMTGMNAADLRITCWGPADRYFLQVESGGEWAWVLEDTAAYERLGLTPPAGKAGLNALVSLKMNEGSATPPTIGIAALPDAPATHRFRVYRAVAETCTESAADGCFTQGENTYQVAMNDYRTSELKAPEAPRVTVAYRAQTDLSGWRIDINWNSGHSGVDVQYRTDGGQWLSPLRFGDSDYATVLNADPYVDTEIRVRSRIHGQNHTPWTVATLEGLTRPPRTVDIDDVTFSVAEMPDNVFFIDWPDMTDAVVYSLEVMYKRAYRDLANGYKYGQIQALFNPTVSHAIVWIPADGKDYQFRLSASDTTEITPFTFITLSATED